MIAGISLSDLADIGTFIGAVIAVCALLYTAVQVRASALVNRANFWLVIEKMFLVHDPVHLNLRPGCQWANAEDNLVDAGGKWADGVTAPTNSQEWAALEDYMGLFEHCEIMMKSKLIDARTFSAIYSYRLRNIMANRTIVRIELQGPERELWTNFLDLLERMGLPVPPPQ